jgi:hypothetical protein
LRERERKRERERGNEGWKEGSGLLPSSPSFFLFFLLLPP